MHVQVRLILLEEFTVDVNETITWLKANGFVNLGCPTDKLGYYLDNVSNISESNSLWVRLISTFQSYYEN